MSFNSVFHNRSDIKNILSFFNLEFHKSPTISNLNTNGIRPKKENEFRLIFKDLQDDINNNKLHIEKDLFFSSPDASDITIFTHKFNNNVLNNYNDFYKRNHTIYKIPTGTCIPFSKKMFLTVNGKILPCERIGQESCLGFVNKENVEIDFKKICYKYNKLLRKYEGQCKVCYKQASCQQCIYNKKGFNSKGYCLSFMNEEIFEKYLTRNINFMENNPYSYNKIMKEIIIR